MAFGNRNNDQPMSEINVTPLVDVMLVLLVVFIVTAPLLTQSVGVSLPKTVAAAAAPKNPTLLVSLNAEGGLFLDSVPQTPESLESALMARKTASPELTVQFEIDERVLYGKAAAILAIAQRAGISKVALQTRP